MSMSRECVVITCRAIFRKLNPRVGRRAGFGRGSRESSGQTFLGNSTSLRSQFSWRLIAIVARRYRVGTPNQQEFQQIRVTTNGANGRKGTCLTKCLSR